MGREKSQVRRVDGKGRVTLPASFADCTVLVERPDDCTVVLRKARVVPLSGGGRAVSVDDPGLAAALSGPAAPGGVVRLSGADAAAFEAGIANPPPPTPALKKLLRGGRRKKS